VSPAAPPEEARWGRWDPWLYGAVGLGIAAVFAVSAFLPPDPSGLGTHTRLGLPPCGVWQLFHKPCPSCGMTTAFALLTHGRPIEALKVQPAGTAVFLAALWLLLYIPLAVKKRRPFEHLFELRAFLPTVLFLIVLILAFWGWRLAMGR